MVRQRDYDVISVDSGKIDLARIMSSASTKKLGGRTAIVSHLQLFLTNCSTPSPHSTDLVDDLVVMNQVGCGSRGQLFLKGVVERMTNNPANKVVAFCDINEGRVKYYNKLLQELGQPVSLPYQSLLPSNDSVDRDVYATARSGIYLLILRTNARRGTSRSPRRDHRRRHARSIHHPSHQEGDQGLDRETDDDGYREE